MKHPKQTTIILICLFLVSQIIGLSLLFLEQDVTTVDGNQQITYKPTALGERPQMSGQQIFFFLAIGVGLGTALILFLAKMRAFKLWKAWFFLAVWISLSIAFDAIMNTTTAFVLAAILAGWKLLKPNPLVHNLTELFIYAGIAILLVPMFDLFWGVILLVAISAYDAYAVWHSKHMITLAKAQSDQKMFAGLYVPRSAKKITKESKVKKLGKIKKSTGGNAILGGGDMAFPLIFSGIVLQWLIADKNILPNVAFSYAIIISITSTLALAGLFFYSKPEKFYPAMPFISAGCFVGFGIIALFI